MSQPNFNCWSYTDNTNIGKDSPCPKLCAIYWEIGKLVLSTWARTGHSFPFPPRFMSTRSLWTQNLLAIGFYTKDMKIIEFCTQIYDTKINFLSMWQEFAEPTWVEDASNVLNSTGLKWKTLPKAQPLCHNGPEGWVHITESRLSINSKTS